MNVKLNIQILLCLYLLSYSAFGQEVIQVDAESPSGNQFLEVSNWIPLNAYSIAPPSLEGSLELSAMPVNWAVGIAFGKSEEQFVRLSFIANWRLEYKIEAEQESFSIERAGLGAMLDYNGMFYAGIVFPVEIGAVNLGKSQILIGMQVALKE